MLSLPPAPIRSSFIGIRCPFRCTALHSCNSRSICTKSKAITTIASAHYRRRRPLSKYGLHYASSIRSLSTTSAHSEATPPSSPPSAYLTWNDYLSLRRSRRNYNLVASVLTSACTTAGGLSIVSNHFDAIGTWMTLDPLFIMGIGTIVSAGAGWLSGPILGNALFRMLHRRLTGEMVEVDSIALIVYFQGN